MSSSTVQQRHCRCPPPDPRDPGPGIEPERIVFASSTSHTLSPHHRMVKFNQGRRRSDQGAALTAALGFDWKRFEVKPLSAARRLNTLRVPEGSAAARLSLFFIYFFSA